MKLLHNAKITIFVKPEDKTSIEEYGGIIHKLFPLDFEKEKISLNIENVEGLDDRKMQIISSEISKEAHTNLFVKNIKTLLGNHQCKLLKDQKESRLDDELYLYIRLDRESALEDKWILTDSGDCIHIKLSLAAFPKHKNSALKLTDDIFA